MSEIELRTLDGGDILLVLAIAVFVFWWLWCHRTPPGNLPRR